MKFSLFTVFLAAAFSLCYGWLDLFTGSYAIACPAVLVQTDSMSAETATNSDPRSTEQLLAEQSFAQQPVAQQPVAQQPVAEQPVADPVEILVWPAGLPADAKPLGEQQITDAKAKTAESEEGYIYYVDSPSLSYFPADPAIATGASVIICPGGGYYLLAWRHEGVDIARWFNSIGVSAFVLKYRVPRRDPARIYWEPLQDLQRSIRLVRHHAADYQLDPNRIGVLGFSAGGHLSIAAGLNPDLASYPPVDEMDRQSCRPDFVCPIYAAYLAPDNKDDVAQLGPLVNVTPTAPPMYLAVTWDDDFRGAQSAMLFVELKKNNVPAELHVFSTGGHGYGIRPTGNPVSQWHLLLQSWLEVSGFLAPSSAEK